MAEVVFWVCDGDVLISKSSQKVVKYTFDKTKTRTNLVFMRVYVELVDGFEPPTC